MVDCVRFELTLQGYLTPEVVTNMVLHRPHGYRWLLVNSPSGAQAVHATVRKTDMGL
jgi:hypothetical protein